MLINFYFGRFTFIVIYKKSKLNVYLILFLFTNIVKVFTMNGTYSIYFHWISYFLIIQTKPNCPIQL